MFDARGLFSDRRIIDRPIKMKLTAVDIAILDCAERNRLKTGMRVRKDSLPVILILSQQIIESKPASINIMAIAMGKEILKPPSRLINIKVRAIEVSTKHNELMPFILTQYSPKLFIQKLPVSRPDRSRIPRKKTTSNDIQIA
jgi:hypothetical protein